MRAPLALPPEGADRRIPHHRPVRRRLRARCRWRSCASIPYYGTQPRVDRRRLRPSSRQLIAEAADVDQDAGVRRIWFELAAEAVDVDGQRLQAQLGLEAPDALEDPLARQHLVRVAGEEV